MTIEKSVTGIQRTVTYLFWDEYHPWCRKKIDEGNFEEDNLGDIYDGLRSKKSLSEVIPNLERGELVEFKIDKTNKDAILSGPKCIRFKQREEVTFNGGKFYSNKSYKEIGNIQVITPSTVFYDISPLLGQDKIYRQNMGKERVMEDCRISCIYYHVSNGVSEKVISDKDLTDYVNILGRESYILLEPHQLL